MTPFSCLISCTCSAKPPATEYVMKKTVPTFPLQLYSRKSLEIRCMTVLFYLKPPYLLLERQAGYSTAAASTTGSSSAATSDDPTNGACGQWPQPWRQLTTMAPVAVTTTAPDCGHNVKLSGGHDNICCCCWVVACECSTSSGVRYA